MTNQNTHDLAVEQKITLNAFSSALKRESHVLTKQPDILWQQLYNRLQWDNGSATIILEAEAERRILLEDKSWVRTYSAFPESKTLTKVLAGHVDRVSACAFSSDGSWIASASQDGTLKIWDTITSLERATLKGHESGVNACAISRDGAFVVSASKDETLKVWDAKSGVLRATLQAHKGPVTDCKISPDGSYIVSAGWDCVLRLWDPKTGELIRVLPDDADTSGMGPYTCSISHDGSSIATVIDGSLCVWDVASGKRHDHLDTRLAQEGGPFDFSPDGRLIACANRNATVSLWDLVSDREHIHLQGSLADEIIAPIIGENFHITDPSVSAIKFSPDGTLLATGNNLGVVRIWDTATGRERTSLALHSQPVTDCTFSPDGKFVISASDDHTIRLSDALSGSELGVLEGHGSEVTQCISSPDGTMILSASDDSMLYLWGMPDEAETDQVSKHSNLVSACAISPDSTFAVSASRDGALAVWDMSTGMVKAACLGHLGPVEDCAVSPGGHFLVSWSDDLTMRLWDPATGREQAALREGNLFSIPGQSFGSGTAKKCAISPDGSYAITIWMNLIVWDLSSGKQRLKLIRTDAGVGETCAIAPDASFFAAGNNSSIAIYDAVSGTQRRVLEGKGPLALSPDGRLIVNCGIDSRTLIISDVHTGSQQATLIGHKTKVRTCTFSHDRSFVVSGAEDGSVKIWDASLGVLLSETSGHDGIVWDCAVTPDDGMVITIGDDRLLRLWDPLTGAAVGSLPLFAEGTCFALDRARPTAIVGDLGGSVYLAEIISAGKVAYPAGVRSGGGLEYKQIIATAAKLRNRLVVSCPLCKQEHQITEDQLGNEISCYTPDCGMRIRLNPFIVGGRPR